MQSTLRADLSDIRALQVSSLPPLYTRHKVPGCHPYPELTIHHTSTTQLNVELSIHLSPSPKFHSQVEWDYDHRHPVPGRTLKYHSSTMQRSTYPILIILKLIAYASGSALPFSGGIGNRASPGANAAG